MVEPLVSVLIPLYNHSEFVIACLDSVRDEGYPKLELLVLNDGSTDDSFEKVQAWIQENREHFLHVQAWSQPNAGICRTLNRLIAEAKGEFVTFVASDDALLSGGIQARINYLGDHPEQLAVFGDATVIDEYGRLHKKSAIEDEFRATKKALCNPKRLARELLLRWCVPGPVFLARRSTWDPVQGIGPYREDLVVEDRDFYLRLLARQAIGFLDQAVAQYRLHSSNISRHELRNEVIRDIHRSHLDNIDRFDGMNRFILRLLILKHKGAGTAPYRKRWLARQALGILRALSCFIG